MASPTAAPPKVPSKPPAEPRAETIDRRIRQTRRQLKLNDFATGLIALVAGVLGFLLVAALADHWLVSGGLGFKSRLILFLGLVGGAGWYCIRVLLPPLVYQVNPVYAAKTLEQARPSLKNGLINLLLLRREGKVGRENPLAERVIEGLQATTASEVDQIPAEVAVDRSHLIRRGYVLVALVALAAAYLVFSPKNPLPSFGRVLWPWARIAAPSRVTIEQISPGNATVFQGRSVTVSAVVEGLRTGEEVFLRYSTDDGQIVDQEIPMTPGQGFNRFECRVPPAKAGLQQSLRYRLVAGDCVTLDYLLEMEVPPTIVVDSVRYIYPPYTGLAERVATDTADVRAIEGTRIALEATANREIQWAGIEISGRTNQRTRMRIDGKQARGEFRLELGENGESSQRWYQIRFAESETGENRENLDPVRHRIEVFPDRPPQIRWESAPPDNATVPLDGSSEMQLEASDPDFALARVAVLAERDGRPLPIPLLLDRTDTGKGYEGQFKATYRFEPAKLGLRVGDEVQYRAVAEDNRQPQRNRSETEPRRLKISPPERIDPQQSDKPSEDGSPTAQDKSREGRPDDQNQDGNQPGESQEPQMDSESNDPNGPADESGKGAESEQTQPGQQGGDQTAEQSEQSGEKGSPSDSQSQQNQDGKGQEGGEPGQEGGRREQPLDPEANPGDVFDEVLKQREKEMQEEGQKSESGDQSGEGSQAKPTDETKPGEGESAGEPQAGEQSPDASEHEGESNVPPNRMEQGGGEGGEQTSDNPQDMKGQGDQPGEESANENKGQSPETEGEAGAGKPTGKPGKGETSDDAETVDGGKAKPEDLENAKIESVERKPGTPGDGKEPDSSQKPQPGSPKPGDQTGGKPTGKPEEAQPTPMPQEANQPNAEKPTGGKPTDQQQKPEATSPSTSKKQSKQDQREPSDGDRSGNGGKGGGQDSDRQGLGNPGSSTPDNEGGQPGGEQGEGETGPGAGDKVPTDQPTGNQAGQPGGKRQGDNAPQGGKPGQGSQDNPQMPPGQPQPPTQPSTEAPGATPGSAPKQQGSADAKSRQPGGNTGEGNLPGEGAENQPPGSDAANKEYAEKATNLALEYLEDQLNEAEPNQELLDRLGWTQQDLERFVRKWQKMKADAKEPGTTGEDARQELDDALKSLGLRPSGTTLKGGGQKTDSILKTEAIRSAPPAAWRELTREYTKSIGSGEE